MASRPNRHANSKTKRPLIVFLDYPDVFEDFYPHFSVTQEAFGRSWAASGNHGFLARLQQEVGDVLWYQFCIRPQVAESQHALGFRVRFLRSSWLHRRLHDFYYFRSFSWRLKRFFDTYEAIASYASQLSLDLLRALRRDRPDAFFLQDYATGRFDVMLLVARLLGVPLVAYHAGSQPERYAGRRLRAFTLRHAAALIASSASEARMLETRFAVPRDRIVVMLTPIDTERFAPCERTAACRAAGLDPARRYVLFMGRLDDQVKRISAIMRSFAVLAAEHRETTLVIAGTGPDEDTLKALASSLDSERIRMVGWVADVDARCALYAASDLLLLPSIKEGFPSVVGEAMACGTPVLGSAVGGVPELVRDGETGWLVPPGDEPALMAAMQRALTNPGTRTQMRQAARRMALARVSLDVVGGQLRQVFQRLGVALA